MLGGGAARGLPGAVGEKPPFWKQRAPGPDGITLPRGLIEAGFGVLGGGGGRGALDKASGLSGHCVSVGAFPLFSSGISAHPRSPGIPGIGTVVNTLVPVPTAVSLEEK